MDELGLTAAILPELGALRGVEQNRYHHLDVHDHTLEVLEQTLALEADPRRASRRGARRRPCAALLAEPLADELDRGVALRLGALLHDAAKPATLGHRDDGTPTFLGHDREGARAGARRPHAPARQRAAQGARRRARRATTCGSASSSTSARCRGARCTATSRTCEPVEVDVTLLSVADRLATRGRKADEAIAKHLELAREVLPAALALARRGPPRAARARRRARRARSDLDDGPQLGRLLAAIDEARFAGEVATPDEAIALAARLRED